MFRHSLNLGHLFGVRIRLNWSVLIIFALIVVNLAMGVFPAWHPEWSGAMNWLLGLLAALVFFASLLAHEMAHSLVAMHYRLKVHSITLFLFGGVSDISEEPDTPGREIAIAAAGPLVSLGLGVGFLVWFWALAPPAGVGAGSSVFARLSAVGTVLGWVGAINLLLAAFNLLPALPLDGGRIFRAILWWASGSLKKATRWAVGVARVFSWVLIAAGIAMALGLYIPLLGTGLVGGLWLAFIGWFLGQSAAATYAQLVIDESLKGLVVSHFVHGNAPRVDPATSIDTLIEAHFMGTQNTSLPVVRDGQFLGMIHFSAIHAVDQDAWESTPVADILTDADQLHKVTLRDPASDVLKYMFRHNLDCLPVVQGAEFRGIVERGEMLKWAQIHSQTSMETG